MLAFATDWTALSSCADAEVSAASLEIARHLRAARELGELEDDVVS